MPVRVHCPGCQVACTVADDLCGKNVRCPRCQKVFRVAVPTKEEDEPLPVVPVPEPAPPEAPPLVHQAIQSTRGKVPPPADKPHTPPPGRRDAPSKRRVPPLTRTSRPGLRLLLIGGVVAAGLLIVALAGGAALWFFHSARPAAPQPVPDVALDPDDREKPPAPPGPAGAEFNLAEARKSVVFIKRVTPGLGTSVGTGFLVRKDGLVYTNRHVVEAPDPNARGILLLVGVPTRKDPDTLDYFRAEVVHQPEVNTPLDFAVLKITARPEYGDFPTLPLSFEKVGLGARVAALGFPHIKDDQPVFAFNQGAVSATRVVFDGKAYYQTDAAVNPGNSGGPLVNARGEAVGIVTFKKDNANNMGYAVYLGEVQEAAQRGEELAARVRPPAGPLDPKTLPTAVVVQPRAGNWAIVQGQLGEKKDHLTVDNNGGPYWMTTREPLPEDFQVVIPCHTEFLQGRQVIHATQKNILRTMCVRFGTDDTATGIMEGTGYTLRHSHRYLQLMREKQTLIVEWKGNPDEPYILSVTKQGGEITVAVNGEVLLRHNDPQPLPGRHKLQLGGYLSRLSVGEVSITKLGEPAAAPPVVAEKGAVETVVTSTRVVNDVAHIAVEAKLKAPAGQVRSAAVYYAREEAGQALQPGPAGNWPQIPNARWAPLQRQADRATGSIQIQTAEKGVVTYVLQTSYTTADGRTVYAPPIRHPIDFGQAGVQKPPPSGTEAVVKQLPSAVADVCAGGGGRFLILHLPQQRQLAVFDVKEAKVVKYLPVAEDNILFAAGADKLIVALPNANLLQRWSLSTFEREATVPNPVPGKMHVLLLGSASQGPLVIGNAGAGTGLHFLDPQTFKPLPYQAPGGGRDFGIGFEHYPFHVRISADGTVLTAWRPSLSPTGLVSLVRIGNTFKSCGEGVSVSYVLPGPDGKTLFTSNRLYTAECKPIGEPRGGHDRAIWLLPAVHGQYYLSLNQTSGGGRGALSTSVYMLGDNRPLATLQGLDGLEGLVDWVSGRTRTLEKHVFLVPDARLLVVLPATNDKLIIHRFDLDQILEKSGIDYLIVTSQPPPVAGKGGEYSYPIAVKSKKGGVKYRLEAGPEGMKVAADGKLTWIVPADAADGEHDVIITVSDATGQEAFHTFKVRVSGEAAVKKEPEPVKPNDKPKDPAKPDDKPRDPPPVGGIKPPALDGERVERQLPAAIGDVCLGGGGRFLILSLPQQRKLAVFDVNEARVVKYLPMAEDRVRFAAGRDKLLVVLPNANVLQRWSLSTFEREVAVPLPFKAKGHLVLLGSASDGPLCVDGAFIDIKTLRVLDIKWPGGSAGGVGEGYYARISADGKVIGMWRPNTSPQGILTYTLEGSELKHYGEHDSAGHVIPGPDGKAIYTARGRFANPLNTGRKSRRGGGYALPAAHGNYYLILQLGDRIPGREKPGGLTVHLDGDGRPLVTLRTIELPEGVNEWDREEFGNDKRIHLIPAARLIVTIPATNDRLVLHRFDVEEALEKSGIDYLFITSQPAPVAKRGEKYEYPMGVRSKKGGLTYRVETGPEGMAVSPAGLVTWQVPADYAEPETDVILAIRDSAGQECFHRFPVSIAGSDDPTKDTLVYLCDLKEGEVKPGPWPFGKGHMGNPEQARITVNGKRALKGLGLHATQPYASVQYRLDKNFKVFRSGVAINDTSEGAATAAEFEVLGDGKSLWKSKPIRARGETDECKIDVSGVAVLELRINLKAYYHGAHTVWIDPYVYRGR